MALTDSLIAWWPMDEPAGSWAIDAHSVNHLSENGGNIAAGSGGGRDLESGSSQYFDRSDNLYTSSNNIQYLSVTDEDFCFAGTFTLESKAADQSLICKWTSGSLEYGLFYLVGDDRFEFYVSSNGTASANVVANVLGSPSTATPYFIFCAHDSANNQLIIQVNNGTADTAPYSSGVFNGTSNFRVGSQGSGAGNSTFDGVIRGVAFWKGRILSAGERTTLYNGGTVLPYPGQAFSGTTFVSDSFTDSAGTNLSAHTGETGATWTQHTSLADQAPLLITDANRIRPNSAPTAGGVYWASGTLNAHNYFVKATIHVASLPASGNVGVVLRAATGSALFFYPIYNLSTGAWEIWKSVGAGQTLLGSVTQTLTVGNDYVLKVAVTNGRITLIVDNIPRISIHTLASETLRPNAIKVGVTGYGAFTNSTGLHIADFMAGFDWTKSVVCDGDSLTDGATLIDHDYPQQIMDTLGTDYSLANMGIGGQTISDMDSDSTTDIDPLYSSLHPCNVLVAWCGTNDIYFNTDAATVESRLQTYCAARQSAGFKVAVCTLTPRNDFPGTSTLPGPTGPDMSSQHEAIRADVNAWLRLNYASFADALIDLGADSRIGDKGDEDSTTYYSADKVHLNATGLGVVAELVEPVVVQLAAATTSGGGLYGDLFGDLYGDLYGDLDPHVGGRPGKRR